MRVAPGCSMSYLVKSLCHCLMMAQFWVAATGGWRLAPDLDSGGRQSDFCDDRDNVDKYLFFRPSDTELLRGKGEGIIMVSF